MILPVAFQLSGCTVRIQEHLQSNEVEEFPKDIIVGAIMETGEIVYFNKRRFTSITHIQEDTIYTYVKTYPKKIALADVSEIIVERVDEEASDRLDVLVGLGLWSCYLFIKTILKQ